MRRIANIIFLCVAAVVLSQCVTVPPPYVCPPNNNFPAEISQAYESAQSATLYSLSPWPRVNEWEGFHGFQILGTTKVDGAQLATIFEQLKAGVDSNEGVPGCVIEPRHGLRVVKNGHQFDLVICYQCGQIEVFKDNVYIKFLFFGHPIQERAKPDFLNNILQAAKVPLSPI